MTTLNLTQHKATPDQLDDGVVELSDELRQQLVELLTFVEPPTGASMSARAHALAELVVESGMAEGSRLMVAGAPWFMPTLVSVLEASGFEPVCAFSTRESVEVLDEHTGKVTKRSVFRHVGWVRP